MTEHTHLWVIAKDAGGFIGASCYYGTCKGRLTLSEIETILNTKETKAVDKKLISEIVAELKNMAILAERHKDEYSSRVLYLKINKLLAKAEEVGS